MPNKGTADSYVNVMSFSVTQAVLNALEFFTLDVGLNIFDKVGLLLSRWEFELDPSSLDQFIAMADVAEIALTQSNQLPNLSLVERAVIDKAVITGSAKGVAANYVRYDFPIVRSFGDMPLGGVLITPRPLYVAVDTAGLAGVLTVAGRLYFRVITLKPEEYFELLESRQFFG